MKKIFSHIFVKLLGEERWAQMTGTYDITYRCVFGHGHKHYDDDHVIVDFKSGRKGLYKEIWKEYNALSDTGQKNYHLKFIRFL